MKALQYERPGKINFIDSPIPTPNDSEVLISIDFAGICGTDLHIMDEESPSASEVVLGHEFSGKIISVGRSVHQLKVGNLVAIDPNNYCGQCQYCRKGLVHFCENLQPLGVYRDGGWAQYCVVPQNQVYSLPPEVPQVWGALGEPLSCILHGWDRLSPIGENAKILILGSGIIGLLWALVLRNYHQLHIVISEPNQHRRNLAENLGFRTTSPGPLLALSDSQHSGFDVIIDCSGSPEAIRSVFPLINPLGKILLFGVCPMDSQLQIEPFAIFKKELTLLGSVINPFTFSRALKIIPQILRPIESLGIKYFDIANYQNAIKMARSGEATKVMFTPNGLEQVM